MQNFFQRNNNVNPNNFNNVISDFVKAVQDTNDFYSSNKKISRKQIKSNLKSWIHKSLPT